MNDQQKAHPLLQQAYELSLLRQIDLSVVDFIQRRQGIVLPPSLALGMALVSRHSAKGHVCIDLQKFHQSPHALLSITGATWVPDTLQTTKRLLLDALGQLFASMTLSQWLEKWQQCQAIWVVSGSAQATDNAPFVLDMRHHSPLLYMQRYWQYEHSVHQFITQKCTQHIALPDSTRSIIEQLFPQPTQPTNTNEAAPLDWQKIAVAIAIRQGFSIITGGPGTGKTTTVLKLLCLLQALRLEQHQTPWNIALTAHTGKAASRLNESIAANLARVALPTSDHYDTQQLRQAIPTKVSTLHRLLGSQPNSRHFLHHANNPLNIDIVVVDEASMIDLDTMASLTEAIGKHTRLILIGDKDQLASVEAGSVLGDLCAHAHQGHYTKATMADITQLTGDTLPAAFHNEQGTKIAQATCMLRQSHRFAEGGAIAQLAALVNQDSAHWHSASQTTPEKALLQQVTQEQQLATAQQRKPQLQTFCQPNDISQDITHTWVAGYGQYLKAADDFVTTQASDNPDSRQQKALQLLQIRLHFQVLVAVNQGSRGLGSINQNIENSLVAEGLLSDITHNNTPPMQITDHQHWYHGRPVIVVRNDYALNLMNGDMGICLHYWPQGTTQTTASKDSPDSATNPTLRVLFSDGKGGVRWVLPSRLHHVVTAFAMTVHKSQGSEFDHAMLLLPNQSNPVLSKELMYTAITRARQQFSLVYGHEHILHEAITQRIDRASGLGSLLENTP